MKKLLPLTVSLIAFACTQPEGLPEMPGDPEAQDEADADELAEAEFEKELADEAMPVPAALANKSALTVKLRGLEPLGAGYDYEGWIIANGQAISAGRFDLEASNPTAAVTFYVDTDDAANATAYVLTIEPAVGDVPAPSKVHVLAGDFLPRSHGASAALMMKHGAAFGQGFLSTTTRGAYVLATPSSADTTDGNQGLWFVKNGAPGLTLPVLPEGWTYEGWIVGSSGPISTGRFSAANQADSDGAGPAAGPIAGPTLPGQDFINPALELPGLTVVLSVEPSPDNSPAPFAIKPLVNFIDDALAPTSQRLSNQTRFLKIGGLARLYLN